LSEPGSGPQAAQGDALQERRLTLEERKQRLEESWPKKGGGITLGAFATLAASAITASIAYYQHKSDAGAAQAAAGKELQLKQLENDRQAVTLFFQYLADKRESDPRRQDEIGLIASITTNPRILTPFRNAKVEAAVESGGSPSDALRGAPNLIAPQSTYRVEQFTAYIQYQRDSDPAKTAADALQATLHGLGLSTPGLQRVANIPGRNEIRIYKPAHQVLAQTLARTLAADRNGVYCIRQLPNPQSLPDGVMEFWIGGQNSPTAGAAC
jgi:hypothetical protein